MFVGKGFLRKLLHLYYTPAPKENGIYCFTLVSVFVCNQNFCRILLSNYLLKALDILAHSLFWHTICWDFNLY